VLNFVEDPHYESRYEHAAQKYSDAKHDIVMDDYAHNWVHG